MIYDMAMGLNTGKFNDFEAGLNFVDSWDELEPNEIHQNSHDIQPIGGGGGFMSRWGHRYVNLNTLPIRATADDIKSGMVYTVAGSTVEKVVLSANSGRIFLCDMATPAITEPTLAGVTPSALWRFEQSIDNAGTQYIYCTWGAATSLKINISTGVVTTWAPANLEAGRCIKSWKNRMVVGGLLSNSLRIRWSDINNPDSWPANNFLDIKSVDAEDDAIFAMEVIGEDLIIFKQKSVWVVYDAVTFENRRVGAVGVSNSFATAAGDNEVFFISKAGVYKTDGELISKISQNIEHTFTSLAATTGRSAWSLNDSRICYAPGDRLIVVDGAGKLWECYLNLKGRYGPSWWTHMKWPSHTRPEYMPFVGVRQSGTTTDIVGVYNSTNDNRQRLARYLVPGAAGDDLGEGLVQYFWEWVSPAIRFQGLENIERLRRVTVRLRGHEDAAQNLVWAIDANIDNSVQATGNLPVLSPASGGSRWFSKRFRPETRGALQQMSLTVASFGTLPVVATQQHIEVAEIEFKYRGGKEH